MPPGRVLHVTAGSLLNLRVSPDMKYVAVIDHPRHGDVRGTVMIVDTEGHIAAQTPEWNLVAGLDWSPDGREVWYASSLHLESSDLRAIDPRGRERVVARLPGVWTVLDVGPDRQVLLLAEKTGASIRGRSNAADEDRELGWFDFSVAADISIDGRTLLFEEQGIYGGPLYAVCLRGMDGSDPVRLGEGSARALSPDGKWALAVHYGPPQRLLLLPTGTGESRSLPPGPIEKYTAASWMPDGRSVVFAGSEPGHARRTYVQALEGGPPRPITPGGMAGACVSPDGGLVAASTGDRRLFVCPTDGDSARFVTQLQPSDEVIRWTADGRSIYVGTYGASANVSRIDIATGNRTPWRTFGVPDSVGVEAIAVLLTPDGEGHVFSYARSLHDLYLVDGLK
jgi:dipeptidyl aminopeptidase/acylaminoacyl peptidase